MRLKHTFAGLTIALAGVITPVLLTPAVALAAPESVAVVAQQHKCTKTSSGTCIKGGQFCPQAKYHKSGWDAQGRRYVCKGNKKHPHWMKP